MTYREEMITIEIRFRRNPEKEFSPLMTILVRNDWFYAIAPSSPTWIVPDVQKAIKAMVNSLFPKARVDVRWNYEGDNNGHYFTTNN